MARGGLGRGLDALLGGEDESRSAGVKEVRIGELDVNPNQPRKSFDEERLQELAASIKRHGIVQPLLVRKNGSRYTIVAGERRYRAARMLGLSSVPVIITALDEQKTAEVSLIENIQREDLNPIEEAAAINFLMKQHDLTQEEISERIGKSRSAIANSLRLLKLDSRVQAHVADGKLSAGHAKMLAGVEDAARQRGLAERCISEGWSVRMLEEALRAASGKKPSKRKKSEQSREMKELTRTFREHLGAKVEIQGSEERGKVIISYYSKDDLENIYKAIVE
ncbi:MAG: ParB/RepB/Spo0J family partition protein [Clostridia bacterium]|nr:ParB/RepB/Spo0J family partition protein [Clostridia bacterium]